VDRQLGPLASDSLLQSALTMAVALLASLGNTIQAAEPAVKPLCLDPAQPDAERARDLIARLTLEGLERMASPGGESGVFGHSPAFAQEASLPVPPHFRPSPEPEPSRSGRPPASDAPACPAAIEPVKVRSIRSGARCQEGAFPLQGQPVSTGGP
jgi:hypothetical protein